MIKDDRTIMINSKKIMKLLVFFTITLVFLYILCRIFVSFTGHDYVYGIIPLFLLNGEANIPAFFSAILLFLSAMLLSLISMLKCRERDVFSWQWTLLACIFLWLSFDEAAGFHELMVRIMQSIFGSSGLTPFAWIFPGVVLVGIVCSYYFKFWLKLPRKTKNLFFIAAVCYIGGVIAFEALGGYIYTIYGREHLFYLAEVVIEESLEMAGVLIFIHALLDYIKSNYSNIRFISQ